MPEGLRNLQRLIRRPMQSPLLIPPILPKGGNAYVDSVQRER